MSKTIQEAFPGLRLIVIPGGKPRTSWEKLDKWQQNSHYYKCALTYQGRQMTFDFWMGSAYTRPPALLDVMSSLVLEAQSREDSFEAFCANYGYDEDSRQAEKTWRACRQQGKKLERLFGDDYQKALDFYWEGQE